MLAQGHTLSISLGASCDFVYGSGYVDGKLADVTTIRLASGDAVVFNGQRLPHSVPTVYDVRARFLAALLIPSHLRV